MASKKYEAQLASLDALRGQGADTAAASLPKFLSHKSNYIVAKAAKVAADLGIASLAPELLRALDRFYTEDDPQCWAKNALIDAVSELGHGESAIYLRGMKHVQMEPVYGGSVDTAGPLRARCVVALVSCRDLRDVEVLRHLIEALADPEKTVRAEAALAIGRIPRDEAALLLRLRALMGDAEPEVLGACFSALLSIEGTKGFEFVMRFFDKTPDIAGEAAIAIGMTHSPEAYPILKRLWERERRNPQFAAVVLSAIALTNLPEAIEFLTSRVADGSIDAMDALASARLTPEDRDKVKKAAESAGGAGLRSRFAKHFGECS